MSLRRSMFVMIVGAAAYALNVLLWAKNSHYTALPLALRIVKRRRAMILLLFLNILNHILFWRVLLIKSKFLMTVTIVCEGCPWSNQCFEWPSLSLLKDVVDQINDSNDCSYHLFKEVVAETNDSNDCNYHCLRMSSIKSMFWMTVTITFEGCRW
jgi:hypothetical protein